MVMSQRGTVFVDIDETLVQYVEAIFGYDNYGGVQGCEHFVLVDDRPPDSRNTEIKKRMSTQME